jgi:hypothetical protein
LVCQTNSASSLCTNRADTLAKRVSPPPAPYPHPHILSTYPAEPSRSHPSSCAGSFNCCPRIRGTSANPAPFPQVHGQAIYFGGLDANNHPAHNLAWIFDTRLDNFLRPPAPSKPEDQRQ